MGKACFLTVLALGFTLTASGSSIYVIDILGDAAIHAPIRSAYNAFA